VADCGLNALYTGEKLHLIVRSATIARQEVIFANLLAVIATVTTRIPMPPSRGLDREEPSVNTLTASSRTLTVIDMPIVYDANQTVRVRHIGAVP